LREYGLNPKEVLTKEALIMPHRTVASSVRFKEDQTSVLSKALHDTRKA
jgi:hypothetical protein